MAKPTLTPQLLDKRVVERNIKKGLLSREDFDKHLQSLGDVADQAEQVKARLGAEEAAALDDADDEDLEDSDDDAG